MPPQAIGTRRVLDRLIPAILGVLAVGAIILITIGGYLDTRAEHAARTMLTEHLPSEQALSQVGDAVSALSTSAYHVAHRLEPHARLESRRAELHAAMERYEPLAAREPEQARHWAELRTELDTFEHRVAARIPDGELAPRPLAELEYQLPLWTSQALAGIRRHAQVINALAEARGKEVTHALKVRHYLVWVVLLIMTALCAVWLAMARRRERREREHDEEMSRRLKQANDDLNAFAGRIAHDLRSPLTPILVGTQLIAQLDTDEHMREVGGRMDRSARRMARMIDALLHFSRLGGPPACRTSTQVAPVVQDVLDSLTEKFESMQASFELGLASVEVACEPEILGSVVQNLVDNALNHGIDGSPDRLIVIRCRAERELGILEVEDHGQGVPAEIAERIFEPLFQGRSRGSGIGLGLATARRLVESRGGQIELLAALEPHGACFRVTLPAFDARPHKSPPLQG